MFIARNTAKSQVAAIYRKLSVASRDEAVRRARETGLLPVGSELVGEDSSRLAAGRARARRHRVHEDADDLPVWLVPRDGGAADRRRPGTAGCTTPTPSTGSCCRRERWTAPPPPGTEVPWTEGIDRSQNPICRRSIWSSITTLRAARSCPMIC